MRIDESDGGTVGFFGLDRVVSEAAEVKHTSVDWRRAVVQEVDASLKEADLSSSDFPGFAMVRRVR